MPTVAHAGASPSIGERPRYPRLDGFVQFQKGTWIGVWGPALAVVYLLTCVGLYFSFTEKATLRNEAS